MQKKDTIQFIESQGKWGMKLGLDTIGALLDELDNPQKDLKFIHVAGSNGKGSICRILETGLLANNYKVGLYTSPSLEKFNERIRVDAKDISDSSIDTLFKKINHAGLEIEKHGFNYPTAFEIETAMALLYFKEKNCDICIMEVGLGGRLDATNIIPPPLVTIISKISLEHTKYLGNTLEEIAYEKAAIIKPGTHVIVSPQEKEAEQRIKKTASENSAKSLKVIHPEEISLLSEGIDFQEVQYDNHQFKFSLLGNFQRINLLAALEAFKILNEENFHINMEKVYAALKDIHFPGRLEVLHKEPLILIDGAHNLDGIQTLTQNIQNLFDNRKFNVFFGMIEEKDVKKCINEITKIAEKINAVTPNSPDAVSSEDLEKMLKEQTDLPVYAYSEINDAVEDLKLNDPSKMYLFTGSLYLLGEVRTKLLKKIKAIENS